MEPNKKNYKVKFESCSSLLPPGKSAFDCQEFEEEMDWITLAMK